MTRAMLMWKRLPGVAKLVLAVRDLPRREQEPLQNDPGCKRCTQRKCLMKLDQDLPKVFLAAMLLQMLIVLGALYVVGHFVAKYW